ncbi:MAG: PKD domain-containing protein [Bacteroidia bacterium]|nr:PKD domain-containing protein [Bacteroidia bacterium]
MKKKVIYILILLTFIGFGLKAQCPQFFNGAGVASSNPYWIGCSGGNFTIFVQPTIAIIGGYTIDWGDGTNSPGVNLIPPAFISHTYTAAIDTFPVIITTTSPACTISGVVVMELTPSASIQIPLGSPISGCTPASFNFQNSSTNISETTRFTWTFGDGSTAQIFNSTNVGQILSHTYVPGTSNCNMAVTLRAENYCNAGNPSTNIYQPIQVWDRDVVSITPDALIKCAPSNTFHFDNTTNLNCSALGNTQQRYEYWNFGDHWGLGYDSIINWQPFNPPNRAGYDLTYPGLGTYSVLLKDSSFCGVDQDIITVQIIAPPVANLSLSADSICNGQSITATNLSTGTANQFIWDFGDGSALVTVSTTATQTHTYSTVGTFTVTLIANISGASGCTSSASEQVTIKPTPTADFNLGSNNYCDAGTETFINTSSGAIASYSWTFGNGNFSTDQNPLPESYTGAATYNVILNITGTNGCLASRTKPVRVYPSPNAQINPFSVCKGISGTFSDASTTATGNPLTSWLWNFGDGTATSGSQNPAHTFADSGYYNVKLTVTTAYCNNKDSISARVNPLPVSNYLKSVNSGCTPLIVSFTNQSTGASTYSWNFGDGSSTSTAVNPNHTFTNSQTNDTTYTITLTATSSFGCIKTFSSTVTVFHAAHASFTSDYLINCSPLPVQFTNTSTGAIDYSWDFGDGTAASISPNPNHVFVNNTSFLQTYITTLTISSLNGCTNSAVQNILVYPSPNFSFLALPADTGCSPLSISFNAASGGAVYQWDFGDGSTSLTQSPNHTFINNGITNLVRYVQLITTSPFSCKDTSDLNVLIYPNPSANFTQSASLGCSPLIVSFTDNSTIANTSLWDFDDGTSSTAVNPIHTFVNNTSATIIFNVMLQVETVPGCIDTMIRPVEVFPKVTAAFTNPTSACSPLSTVMINNSTNATIYNWNFGDGALSTQTNPSHIYINSGSSNISYTLTLAAQSPLGCVDTATYPLSVFYKPDANFNLSSNAGCPPFPVNFNNTSVGAFNNDWTFGDGSISNGVISPSHTYLNTTANPITNNVQLIVTTTNSCKDTLISPLTVYPKVTPAFTGQADGCSPLNIVFSNQSTNADFYSWEFGDGAVSSQTTTSHTYINNTTINDSLNIILTASSNFGCSDSIQQPLKVFYKPAANFNINSTAGCHPLSISFSDQSSGGIYYFWDFGDASPLDSTINPSHIYTNFTSASITYVAKLKITTLNGCVDSITKNITVYPHVIAAFTGQANGCSPLTLSLTNQSTNTNTYSWDLGDGTLSTQTNLTHTYVNNSSANIDYTILLSATSSLGCVDTQTTVVNVKFKPAAIFSLNTNAGCSPLLVNLTNQSTNALSHEWNFGDSSPFENSLNTSHTYINGTAATITNNIVYIVIANNGCADTAVNSVSIYPKVTSAFTNPTLGCSPFTVDFANQSVNADTYLWDFGNGSFSSQATPSNTYINSTTSDQVNTIQLIASSNLGCADTVTNTTTVAYQPIAAFSATPLSQTYPSAEVSVINTTNTGTWNYSWDWDDSNISSLQNPPSNIYATWGTYDITLIVNSTNCADTVSHSITIIPPLPIAGFTVPPYDGCEPEKICFVNTSQYSVSNTWEFGDGNTSNSQNPCYTYFNAGTFNVKLITTGPGGQTDIANSTVTIHPRPQANFSATPTLVHVPNTQANFLNFSIDADTYFWDFGDGNTSEDENPNYAYSEVGQYDVTLIATNQYGCIDTITKVKYIRAELINGIVLPNAFTPNPLGSNGGVYDPTSYNNDVFFPFTVNGIDEYRLTIFNKWGEIIFDTTDLKVGWDGLYRGTLCQSDVYIWKVKGKYLDGTSYMQFGDVTLLR